MIRKLGLTILAAALVILGVYGIYHLFLAIYSDSELPVLIKVGLSGLVIGVIIIFLGVLKERIEDYRQEK